MSCRGTFSSVRLVLRGNKKVAVQTHKNTIAISDFWHATLDILSGLGFLHNCDTTIHKEIDSDSASICCVVLFDQLQLVKS